MKFMVLADVHQSEKHWELLIQAVLQERPALVAIAGDLLPKYDGILNQLTYLPQLKADANLIRKAGAELVLILGNDDNQLAIPAMEEGDREGLWHFVNDRVKEVKGQNFCGCPWINDYPFAYKYWVLADSKAEPMIDPVQLGPPAEINSANEIETISDLKAYLWGKPSLEEALEVMAARVEKMSEAICLIHVPPVKMDFDLTGSGARVGSPAVYRFLNKKQPLLSIHGHIHEAPALNGGIWAQKIGGTTCIQAGQSFEELNYATFSLRNGRIANLKHSIYGSYRNKV